MINARKPFLRLIARENYGGLDLICSTHGVSIGEKIVFEIVSVQGKIPEQVVPYKIVRLLFYRQ